MVAPVVDEIENLHIQIEKEKAINKSLAASTWRVSAKIYLRRRIISLEFLENCKNLRRKSSLYNSSENLKLNELEHEKKQLQKAHDHVKDKAERMEELEKESPTGREAE
ncbi:unnamed protein product [Ranitomeya imitator]|uniref:Uncharacterized protein n=1 Tax=Ranitomeya imitator TaxID=111125 RepID=A0ABN9L7U1_9NEOB|nr:unnamed protein product [Ranitomeya imitator]